MVSKEVINDILTKTIIYKCNSSNRAKQWGANVSLTTHDDGSYILEYDGASISFDATNNPSVISLDGDNYPYLSNKSYEDFDYQKRELESSEPFNYNEYTTTHDGEIIEKHSYDNDWDFVVDYCDEFASYKGLMLNKTLIANANLTKYKEGILNKSAHNHFVSIERNSRIDSENFVTVRVQPRLYESDNLDKEYFRLPHHISMSVGGDFNELVRAFGTANDSHARSGYGLRRLYESDTFGDWKIFTVVKKGNGNTGLFMGNALRDSGNRTGDWEGELNVAPRTRFVRDIVDEQNKIIIQHMER